MASQGTVYDMAIDPKRDVVVTVGQVCMLFALQCSCLDYLLNSVSYPTCRIRRSIHLMLLPGS